MTTPDTTNVFFKAGITAFKAGDYATAIGHLQLAEAEVDAATQLQVQGWLVRAYVQSHRYGEARSLCETLVTCDRPSVQTWAEGILAQLPTAPGGEPTPAAPQPTPVDRVNSYTEADSTEADPAEFTVEAPLQSRANSFPTTYPTPQRQQPRSTPVDSPRSTPSRSPHVSISKSQDMGPVILSALSHGSISLFGSLLIFLLFPDSLFATMLGIVRLGIPIIVLLTSQDSLAQDNAREATNYVLTTVILGLTAILAGWIVAIALVAMAVIAWPLLILLGLPLGLYLLALSIWPVVATVQCCLNGGQVARYPNWLIWHLI